jgi:hypothetical protein
LFFISSSARFDPQGLPDDPFERGRVARRGPQLEFGVARGSGLQQRIVAAIAQA